MSESKNYFTAASESGSMNISEEVLATIAGASASEVEGVAALAAASGRDPARRALGRSVKIDVDGDGISVEVSVIAEMGHAVAAIAGEVQKAVAGAITDSCGVTPKSVDVRISGVKTH